MSSLHISELQLDTLQELINIGIGKAAAVLNQMVKAHVSLRVPLVKLIDPANLLRESDIGDFGKGVIINMSFGGSFEGATALAFSMDSASNLVALLVGENDYGLDMDSLRIGTLQEVGNIVLNGVVGSISNMLGENLDYMPPDYFEDKISSILPQDKRCEDNIVIFIRANFFIQEHLVEGEIFIIFNSSTLQELLSKIDIKLCVS